MKKALLVLLYLLFSLLAGCETVPFQYDALDAERTQARVEVMTTAGKTDEQIEADKKRFEKADNRLTLYEDTVIGAQRHYLLRLICRQSTEYIWACSGKENYNDRRPPETKDALVRVYRHDRHICGCRERGTVINIF